MHFWDALILYFFYIIKNNNFPGDLLDVSTKKTMVQMFMFMHCVSIQDTVGPVINESPGGEKLVCTRALKTLGDP